MTTRGARAEVGSLRHFLFYIGGVGTVAALLIALAVETWDLSDGAVFAIVTVVSMSISFFALREILLPPVQAELRRRRSARY